MRLPTAMWLVFAGLACGGGYSSRSSASSSASDGEVSPRNDSSAYGSGGTRSGEARGGHGNFAGIAEVLDALEKAVVFFLESYHDINLDGLYGLRVAEVKRQREKRLYQMQGDIAMENAWPPDCRCEEKL
ncbi:hypothetical protein Bbelb_090750 [Branchiostoma belcheri]|nr:hypothetical protein Bbelb_090750 [Branchiostoma belcheri]